jgi:hypothetical protein
MMEFRKIGGLLRCLLDFLQDEGKVVQGSSPKLVTYSYYCRVQVNEAIRLDSKEYVIGLRD